MNNLNILHISMHCAWGGGERHLYNLARSLAKLGLQQYIICPVGSQLAEKLKETKLLCVEVPKSNGLNLRKAYQLKKFCQHHQINIIHVHDAHSHNMVFLSAFLFQHKTAIIVHRKVAFSVKKNFFSQLKYNHPSIKAISCISRAAQQAILPVVKTSAKVHIIYDGFDLKKAYIRKFESKLRQEYGIEERYLIGCVGALIEVKDHATFLKMAAGLVRKKVSAKFIIIGEGPLQEKLKQQAIELGLRQQVIFTGHRNDMADIFPELDILVHTAKIEGLAGVLVEAILANVAIVASNVGGIPELIRHQQNGLLVKAADAAGFADAVLLLLENSALKEKLVLEASKSIKRFDAQRMAEQTKALYH